MRSELFFLLRTFFLDVAGCFDSPCIVSLISHQKKSRQRGSPVSVLHIGVPRCLRTLHNGPRYRQTRAHSNLVSQGRHCSGTAVEEQTYNMDRVAAYMEIVTGYACFCGTKEWFRTSREIVCWTRLRLNTSR